MTRNLTARKLVIGIAVVIVAVIATAFAIGGSGTSSSGVTAIAVGAPTHSVAGKATGLAERGLAIATPVPSGPAGSGGSGGVAAASSGAGASTTGSTGSAASSQSFAADTASSALVGSSSVGATRVVKTGTLSLRVRKGTVPSAVAQIAALGPANGGYVASSRTDDVSNSPTGEVVLRIPVEKFETVVAAAQRLGRQTSLQTSAEDVTGRYVDLAARMHALQRTRHTYLTILGRANTIGATLSVQQRIDGVQQQIEELQGRLKVLRNQSNDGTLTVEVSEAGAPSPIPVNHKRAGFALAWHNSIDRFNRGLQAIIGALGPILLAALLIAFAYVVARIGLRWAPKQPRANASGADIVP